MAVLYGPVLVLAILFMALAVQSAFRRHTTYRLAGDHSTGALLPPHRTLRMETSTVCARLCGGHPVPAMLITSQS